MLHRFPSTRPPSPLYPPPLSLSLNVSPSFAYFDTRQRENDSKLEVLSLSLSFSVLWRSLITGTREFNQNTNGSRDNTRRYFSTIPTHTHKFFGEMQTNEKRGSVFRSFSFFFLHFLFAKITRTFPLSILQINRITNTVAGMNISRDRD